MTRNVWTNAGSLPALNKRPLGAQRNDSGDRHFGAVPARSAHAITFTAGETDA